MNTNNFKIHFNHIITKNHISSLTITLGVRFLEKPNITSIKHRTLDCSEFSIIFFNSSAIGLDSYDITENGAKVGVIRKINSGCCCFHFT